MRNVIMTSSNGNFVLITQEGTGINDTPYKCLKVITQDIAEKHVIDIRLNSNKCVDYNGSPVHYTYNDCNIVHGMRSTIDSLKDTEEYIKVLEEALDFAHKINNYIENSYEWHD